MIGKGQIICAFVVFGFVTIQYGLLVNVSRKSAVTTRANDSKLQRINRISSKNVSAVSLVNDTVTFFDGSKINLEEVSIPRFWTCSDSAVKQHRKLIFVHVPKTAGSTVRHLLLRYGRRCNASVAFSIGCKAINANTLISNNLTYTDPEGKPCHIQPRSIDRDGKKLPENISGFSSQFLQHEVDILGGHLPFGLERYWKKPSFSRSYNSSDSPNSTRDNSSTSSLQEVETTVDALSFTFVRNPYSRVVSHWLYTHPDEVNTLPFETIVLKIRESVLAHNKTGHSIYAYMQWFFHPTELDLPIKPLFSSEIAMKRSLWNIIQHKVIVGVTEYMPESVELLRYAMDTEDEVRGLFRMYSGNLEKKQSKGTIWRKKSPVSTSKVITALQEDLEFWDEFTRFVKLEVGLYDIALEIHKRQYQWLRNQTGYR